MSTKRAALGKGLGALISGMDGLGTPSAHTPAPVTPSVPGPASICEIPVEKISANPYQPRSNFDEQALEELADSIRQLGIIQPITVRKIGLKYQIISGERRFKAAQAAGLGTIPAYIKDTDDQGMLEMAIVENIQREDLDAIEVALSFQRLIDECHLTQESMADKVGKKRATVTNYLRLLKLPAEIQVCIRDKKISMGHAKAILSLTDPVGQLVLDAAGSALVERAADAAEASVVAAAADRGLFCSSRFSPGYGDLSLATQAPLLATLDAQRALGITLSADYLMSPTKSVTAVVGLLTAPREGVHASCSSCPCRDFCVLRASGRTCGAPRA